MNSFSTNISKFLATALIFTIVACDKNDDSFDPSVVNSSLDENQLQVGESTVLKIGLDYDRTRRLFESPDDVKLVVKLPSGVRYRSGTAELQGLTNDEDIRPVITNCDATGEQYLDFDIDGDDLARASDPSGSAEAEVRLIVEAASKTQGIGIIGLQANKDDILFACGSAFASQSDSSIQVL